MRDVLSRFADVRLSGDGHVARCPAHEDRRASLSIGTGDDGRVLLRCHAGCETSAVLAAVGLTFADLHPNGDRQHSRIVARYDYHDESGALLYQVVRFEPKSFRQRRPDGDHWIWKLGKVRRVLFGLPELRGQKVAYLVEGERDVLALRAIGLPATTNAGGAGKWRPEYVAQLKAAGVESVAILPDNDEAGRQHAETIARSCHAAGLRVKLVELPDLPPKGDVTAWLGEGHTRDELVALVKATPLYEPSKVKASEGAAAMGGGLALTALSDLLAEPEEPIEYVLQDCIAAGSVDVLAGKPKAGKSTLARAIAFAVSRGGSVLGRRCQQGTVWYLALEDKRSEVRRHFRQMGADGTEPVRFLFHQPAEGLIARLHALAAAEAPALIIVDTVQRLVKAHDLNDYAEVTTKLTPILTLARETGAAVLLVHHAGKGERAGIDVVLGSTAIAGSVDNVFILTRNDRYRVLSSVQRIGPDLPETVLTLDPETGRVDAGPTRHEADLEQVQTALRDALAAAGSEQTRADWFETVEGRRQVKLAALRALTDAGTIIRAGEGTKGDPYRYRLADSGSQVPVYTREPPSLRPTFPENAKESAENGGSRVPEIRREPEPTREPECGEGDAWLIR